MIPLMRVGVSLPCSVPVVPGTGNAEAPIEERTERCATDAWWIIGRAMICTEHLKLALGDDFETLTVGVTPNESELKPWHERHRYGQKEAEPEWDRKP